MSKIENIKNVFSGGYCVGKTASLIEQMKNLDEKAFTYIRNGKVVTKEEFINSLMNIKINKNKRR